MSLPSCHDQQWAEFGNVGRAVVLRDEATRKIPCETERRLEPVRAFRPTAAAVPSPRRRLLSCSVMLCPVLRLVCFPSSEVINTIKHLEPPPKPPPALRYEVRDPFGGLVREEGRIYASGKQCREFLEDIGFCR